MGETAAGNHHPTPSHTVAPPPSQSHLPLGAAKGPLFQPQEQLTTLHYCIHSNPSWR